MKILVTISCLLLSITAFSQYHINDRVKIISGVNVGKVGVIYNIVDRHPVREYILLVRENAEANEFVTVREEDL